MDRFVWNEREIAGVPEAYLMPRAIERRRPRRFAEAFIGRAVDLKSLRSIVRKRQFDIFSAQPNDL